MKLPIATPWNLSYRDAGAAFSIQACGLLVFPANRFLRWWALLRVIRGACATLLFVLGAESGGHVRWVRYDRDLEIRYLGR